MANLTKYQEVLDTEVTNLTFKMTNITLEVTNIFIEFILKLYQQNRYVAYFYMTSNRCCPISELLDRYRPIRLQQIS